VSDKIDLHASLRLYGRLLGYVKPYKLAFSLAIVTMIIFAASEAAFAALLKPLLDGGFVNKDPDIIRLTPVLLIVVALIRAGGGFVSEYSMAWVGRRVIFDIRNQMFQRLVYLPSAYYDANSSGILISKVIYDVEQVATAATKAVSSLVKDNVMIIGLVGWMIYLNWRLTLLVLVVAPLVSWIMRTMGRRFRAISGSIQRSMGSISHTVQEAIDGQRVVKTFCGQETEIKAFADVNNKNRQQGMKKVATAAAGTSAIHLLAALALTVVVYMALLQSAAGQATVGDFMSYLAALAMLTGPVRRLAQVNEIVQTALAAAQSVFTLLDQAPERDDGTRQLDRVRGRVEYRNVSFRYAAGGAHALRNISFTVEPGQTVALVGTSGSGKTTVANLLPRFYRVEEGEILLDGVDINEVALNNLRSHISLVSQETVLFDDTIRNNILYGQSAPASDARVVEVAHAAHVMDFAQDLPEGLETMVGEKGVRLSGGQRQRIAIARALLKNAPILILDEATSALDTESERHVQAAMQALMRNRTTLVIAHRLSTIENADQILVMARGQIIEIGTHAQLLAANGMYARLHRLQFAPISHAAS
jgi:subfamily B ATP-binding cassette protein MsbA